MKTKLLLMLLLANFYIYAQSSDLPNYIPVKNLLAYYPFNGNGNDASENQFHATVNLATLTTDRFDVTNAAYVFNGKNTSVEAGISKYPQNNAVRTITGWFKASRPKNTLESKLCILSYGSISDPDHSFSISLSRDGKLNIQMDSKTFSTTDSYFDTWTFFAFITDAKNNFSLYINDQYKLSGPVTLSTRGLDNVFRIGKNKTNNYFEGEIDDIGVWNVSLNQQDIINIYNGKNKRPYYTLIPDINLENKLISLGIESGTANGEILTANLSSLSTLNLASASITDLTGIQACASLTELNVSGNQLKTLDLTENKNIRVLNCSNNPNLTFVNIQNGNNNIIKDIDFKNNTRLTCIQVDDDVSANANWQSTKDSNASFSLNCNPTTDIPDINFEKKLISLGYDSGTPDGKILTSRISRISELKVQSSGIKDLTGIQDFLNLSAIYCNDNLLESVDFSKNIGLTNLNCSNNKLTSLDISNNKKLHSLSCFSNELTSLDLSHNTNLKTVNIYLNQISSIDVSKNKLLHTFDCSQNLLSELNLSQNTSLAHLECSINQITSLDLLSNTNLQTLVTSLNPMTKLDVSRNQKLQALYCGFSDLVSLDVSQNTLLTEFVCRNNKLVDLNIKNGNSSLLLNPDFTGNPDLSCIQVDDKIFYDTNWANKKDVTSNYETSCSFFTYTLIPDINFEKKLIQLGIDSGTPDGKILTENAFNQGILDVSASNISDLTGIESFINLYYLDCPNNNLTTIDISKNASLQKLNCTNNQITSLNLPKSPRLKELLLSDNKLSGIDLSRNDSIMSISAQRNLLTGLDLTKTKTLANLNISYNKISRLDLSKNIALKTLDVRSNNLSDLNLKNGKNTLLENAVNFTENPNLSCIQVDNISYSNINWSGLKDATSTFNTVCDIQYTELKDSHFEQKLIDLGIDTDGLNGKISSSDISAVASLDLSNSNITDLSAIEGFTSLTYLDCSNNQLANLDLTNNVLLETLNASSNQITSLDLSKNSKLIVVYVVSNPLVFLNLQNGNNTNMIILNITGRKTASPIATSFLGLNQLGCVKVDDVAFSNTNWSKIKEPSTIYSSTCSLGIEDSVFDKVVLYPNPTKDEVTITNIGLEKATVYNTLGQLVKSFTLNSGNTSNRISLAGLPKGVYYVYLINQEAASVKKVIVE